MTTTNRCGEAKAAIGGRDGGRGSLVGLAGADELA